MAFLHSIRWRIQAWHGLLLVLVTTALLVFFYQYEKGIRVQRVDLALTSDLIHALPFFIAPMGYDGIPQRVHEPTAESWQKHFEESGNYVIFMEPEGTGGYRSSKAPENISKPTAPAKSTESRWSGGNRELIHTTPQGHVLILGRSAAVLDNDLHLLALKLTGIGGILILLGMLVGAWITTTSLRPIQNIADTAWEIANGDWDRRIPRANAATELSDLAAVLNDCFHRIGKNYQQQARFAADASHELGNPVSIVLSQTQHALSRQREVCEYVSALEACRRAGERMRVITRDLLELAGYESGLALNHRFSCDLAEVAREAVAAVSDLADECHALIRAELEPITSQIHPMSLSRALINLLSNALTHNPEGVRVTIRLTREGRFARMDVMDTGRGIPADELPHLFERFYRVDPAGKPSGSGLGLAITRAVIEAHNGSITVTSIPGHGTIFAILLPLH